MCVCLFVCVFFLIYWVEMWACVHMQRQLIPAYVELQKCRELYIFIYCLTVINKHAFLLLTLLPSHIIHRKIAGIETWSNSLWSFRERINFITHCKQCAIIDDTWPVSYPVLWRENEQALLLLPLLPSHIIHRKIAGIETSSNSLEWFIFITHRKHRWHFACLLSCAVKGE